MKKTLRWFTLVELLVVITILAIISVVAYQNFGGAVDKAVSGRKINDVTTLESALQQYKFENNFYPKADDYDANKNVWGYNQAVTAQPSNIIKVVLTWVEIDSINTTDSIWGWKIFGSWSIGQIWAKWTISVDTLGKKYLSKDLYDPEVGDVKVISTSKKMIDYGIGRYVYTTYKKSTLWPVNQNWIAYNIAYTIRKDWTDSYITKIVWDYDEKTCTDPSKCPKTLIWTASWATVAANNTFLVDWQEVWFKNDSTPITGNYSSTWVLQWIPYAATNFSE